jgi:uncharacterized membrane protein YebE (DUF533 family)
MKGRGYFMSAKKITDSQFYMWRTLFAMAHADGVVTNEEIRFMVEAMEDIPFNDDQKKELSADIKTPQDAVKMFEKISDVRDQARFFQYARDIVHADGDYGKAEQELLLKLKKVHLQRADVDKLIGSVNLELTEPDKPQQYVKKKFGKKKDVIFSFRKRFLEEI